MKKFFGFLHHATHAHLASTTRRRRNTLRTILPLFLIFTILAGTFAPLSATFKIQKVHADDQTGSFTKITPTSESVTVEGTYNLHNSNTGINLYVVKKSTGQIIGPQVSIFQNGETADNIDHPFTKTLTGLTFNTEYTLKLNGIQVFDTEDFKTLDYQPSSSSGNPIQSDGTCQYQSMNPVANPSATLVFNKCQQTGTEVVVIFPKNDEATKKVTYGYVSVQKFEQGTLTDDPSAGQINLPLIEQSGVLTSVFKLNLNGGPEQGTFYNVKLTPYSGNQPLAGNINEYQVLIPGAKPTGEAPIVPQGETDSQKLEKALGCETLVDGLPGACIAAVLYHLVYRPTSWFLGFAARVFDSMAALTLSSKLYNSTSFIGYAWGIVRDFANIFFIFILLFIAISLILGLEIGHANPKKMLISVIIIAILLNFSMFFTKIIVDSSNVLALLFYNQITVVSKQGQVASPYSPLLNESVTGVKEKNVSGVIVGAFSLSALVSDQFLQSFYHPPGWSPSTASTIGGGVTGAAVGAGVLALAVVAGIFSFGIGTAAVIGGAAGAGAGAFLGNFASGYDPSILIIIILVSGAIFGYAAYSLFVSSLAFLGRLIQLWLQIIFAPFAFVTYIIPSMQHIEGFGWTNWWKKTIEVAFMAPIFMFFLYLISLLTKSNFIPAIATNPYLENNTAIDNVVLIVIPALIILTLLHVATKYAKKASGELGAMVIKGATGAAQFVGGAALGVAAGAVAYGGRRVAGAIGKAADTETNRDLAAGRVTSASINALKDKYGHQLVQGKSNEEIAKLKEFQLMQKGAERKLKTNQLLSSSSFDMRQTGVGNLLSKNLGINMESFGKLSTQAAAGGYEGMVARNADKKRKFAEKLGSNHDQQTAIEDTIAKREEKISKVEDELSALREQKRLADSSGLNSAPIQTQIVTKERELTQYRKGDKIEKWSREDYEAGVIDPNTGQPINETAVGKPKSMLDMGKVYSGNDVGVTKKADGTFVTEGDVLRSTKTDSLSLDALKKMAENNKKARMNSYFHQEMVQSGYQVHGERYDDLGQVKRLGHMDFKHRFDEAAKAWKQDMQRNTLKGVAGGLAGLAGGALLAGPVGAITGAVSGGVLAGFKDAFATASKTDMWLGKFSSARIQARGTNVASDLDHKIHEFKSTYKAPASKFFSFLGELAKGAESHGSSQGGGASHAGDHH